jgi:antirestriction protein ArdC
VVFNAEQVTGPGIEKYHARPKTPSTFIDCERAEQVIAATGAVIHHGGDRACYRPVDDCIQMPPKTAFPKAHEYYSVAAHELTHWTGHKSRLNRLDTLARFGDESYAVEELVAELGAAFLSAELGIRQSDDLSNVTAYLAHWLKVLESDVTAIFTASSAASKAVDLILGFSENRTEADDEAEPAEAVEVVGGAA